MRPVVPSVDLRWGVLARPPYWRRGCAPLSGDLRGRWRFLSCGACGRWRFLACSACVRWPSLACGARGRWASLAVGTRGRRPSLALGANARRPSLAVGTHGRRPSLALGADARRPSLASGTRGRRPSLALGADARRPSLASGTRGRWRFLSGDPRGRRLLPTSLGSRWHRPDGLHGRRCRCYLVTCFPLARTAFGYCLLACMAGAARSAVRVGQLRLAFALPRIGQVCLPPPSARPGAPGSLPARRPPSWVGAWAIARFGSLRIPSVPGVAVLAS